jgi:electron transfer flavoprotein alpha subunit
MATLLIAEHDNKSLKDATAKAVTATKALGADVHVLVAGKDCKGAADAAAKLDGVKKVLVADAAPYEHQLAEPLAALIVSLAGNYDAIVAPATTTGKNVMPRVAALLDVMQISDVTKVVQKSYHRTHLDLSGRWRRWFRERGKRRGGCRSRPFDFCGRAIVKIGPA